MRNSQRGALPFQDELAVSTDSVTARAPGNVLNDFVKLLCVHRLL